MGFTFLPNELAAVDEALGFRVELDWTFYDETTGRLKISDRVAGRVWSVPIRTTKADVTYATPGGPMTSRLSTSVALSRRWRDEAVADLAVARRGLGRPIEPVDAIAALEEGVLVFMTNGGELLKFVPQFHVVWD